MHKIFYYSIVLFFNDRFSLQFDLSFYYENVEGTSIYLNFSMRNRLEIIIIEEYNFITSIFFHEDSYLQLSKYFLSWLRN